MKSDPDWCDLDPANWLIFVTTAEAVVAGTAGTLRKRGPFVAVVRGCRMRTEHTFHQEFAAALQFPAYYGENMAAFDECLCDVSWLGGGGLLIVVTGASQMLADESANTEVVWDVLLDAREAFRHPVVEHAGRAQPEPYTLVVQDEPAALDRLVKTSPALSRALGG